MLPRLVCLLGLLADFAFGIATISTKGSKLFLSSGEQFFIKGRYTHMLPRAHEIR
jgi:hypothetical protein